MPTFQKCDKAVRDSVNAIITEFESHAPLVENKVSIDLVFAFADRDEDSKEKLNDALTKDGYPCFGITKVIPAKDRALGRGDAEIAIDGDWWFEEASKEQRLALLDHELHHISLKKVKGQYVFDSNGRPAIKLRKHDVQVGWFKIIAERHGENSMERQQAKLLMDVAGQYFWPLIAPSAAVTKPKP